MEQRIRERYSETILQSAARCYGVAPDSLHELDGFESFIYRFERGGEQFILRIGHTLRRSTAMIHGEVDWINYLGERGVSVARAVLSCQGRLVEVLDDGHGESFVCTAFEWAPGASPWEAGWSVARYERYGRLIGRMHALSKEYLPGDPTWKRPEWDDPANLDLDALFPPSQSAIRARLEPVLAHLADLPRDVDSYGLTHQDAHEGNFFIDASGRITLFDFDDSAYCWYANDIAIVLFYMLVTQDDPAGFMQQFMPHFARGYRQENPLDPCWLVELPWFMKLREIDLYAVILSSMGDTWADYPWTKMYMTGRRERIVDDVPYVDFDWSLLTEQF